jgi:GT2 family glycosyltransferase
MVTFAALSALNSSGMAVLLQGHGGTILRMRVSLVMLTYNRADFLAHTMAHNMASAGSPVDELIWVDNGSTADVHEVMRTYAPDVCILNKTNFGVSKGYNRGFAVATGDYIVITGSDMLMPEGWLARFRTYIERLPETGVACVFHQDPRFSLDRTCEKDGLRYHPCLPIGRRIVSRELLTKRIGYLREDFGLYGWEDVEWSHRAVRICKELGLITYAIPGQRAEHLGTARKDPTDYRDFKTRQGGDPGKRALFERCKAENFPYYNPYG